MAYTQNCAHTGNLFVGNAHDIHCLHRCAKLAVVFYSWHRHVALRKEAIVGNIVEEQLACWGSKRKWLKVREYQ